MSTKKPIRKDKASIETKNKDVKFIEPKDSSPYVHQRDKIKYDLKIRELPWTEKQKAIIELFNHKDTKAIFLKGAAGTSKTALAIYCGLQALNTKKVSDMVLIRSAVESSEVGLGYLPGDVDSKMSVHNQAFTEKFGEFIPETQLQMLKDDNRIQMVPVGYTRGLHFSVKFVCCDEFQCLTLKEAETILSRIGCFCKVMICGDPDQSDLPYGKSCFNSVFDSFNNEESREQGIFCIEFTEEDCMRSEFCKYISKTFKKIKEISKH